MRSIRLNNNPALTDVSPNSLDAFPTLDFDGLEARSEVDSYSYAVQYNKTASQIIALCHHI